MNESYLYGRMGDIHHARPPSDNPVSEHDTSIGDSFLDIFDSFSTVVGKATSNTVVQMDIFDSAFIIGLDKELSLDVEFPVVKVGGLEVRM